jgi:ribosomal protein L19
MTFQITQAVTTNIFFTGECKTNSVVPTTATAYAKGDMVKINATTNVCTLATSADDFDGIVITDHTAADSTLLLTNGSKMQVAIEGMFNVAELKLSGVKLNSANKIKAMAKANTSGKFVLQEVVNG